MRRYLMGTVALLSTMVASEAAASLDMAELYLRKVKQGERTFFQRGGWARWRNRVDVFYEGDYVIGAGTGDPRFVDPDRPGDPLGAYSLGGFALLSHQRSAYQVGFFTMISKTFEVNTDNTLFQILPLLAPAVPGAFAKDAGISLSQGITGFQLRYTPWLELSYGLVMDQRRGQRVYRSFVEANVPALFLESNFIPAFDDDRLERVEASFGYDQFTWASNLEAGLLRTNVNDERFFVYTGFEDLFGYLSGNARVTTKAEFAYAELGLHLSKYKHGDARRNGKFGFAWDFVIKGSLTNPSHANYWSDLYGRDVLRPGFKAQAYIQLPMMSWLGVFVMMMSASAAALDSDDTSRQQTIDSGAKAAMATFDASDEDDGVYGGLTLGVDFNDPQTLREVPGAIDKLHVYFRYRVLY